jgi:hypothetical protein
MKFSRSDFEMQRFESRRPSQPARLERMLKCTTSCRRSNDRKRVTLQRLGCEDVNLLKRELDQESSLGWTGYKSATNTPSLARGGEALRREWMLPRR